jgi:hypothetical protein
MGENGGIDKHRQNEIKMKENWRKWNFEGNFNALNFDQNQEKIRKNHFGKWKHWFSRITHGNCSLLFRLPFHFFYSSLIFFPSPKTLWLLSPTPGGGGDYRRIYTPVYNSNNTVANTTHQRPLISRECFEGHKYIISCHPCAQVIMIDHNVQYNIAYPCKKKIRMSITSLILYIVILLCQYVPGCRVGQFSTRSWVRNQAAPEVWVRKTA